MFDAEYLIYFIDDDPTKNISSWCGWRYKVAESIGNLKEEYPFSPTEKDIIYKL